MITSVDLMVLPHHDLHMVLSGGLPPLKLQPVRRSYDPDLPNASPTYTLTNVPIVDKMFQFFAPHKAPGSRLTDVPTLNLDGTIANAKPGVYLWQADLGGLGSIVGRLQVHNSLEDWWFGNDRLTVALDPKFAHTQPSIYARFDDDPGSGADVIGDITGHPYVSLSADEPTKVQVVGPYGRLRGLVATPTTTITGKLVVPPPPDGPQHKLTLTVADYSTPRVVDNVGGAVVAPAGSQKFNILLLSEGFTDQGHFERVTSKLHEELFGRERHQPYKMLKDSFNVFSSFVPSAQPLITRGSRVVDEDPAGLGLVIPTSIRVSPGRYLLDQLVDLVGLPMHGEHRTAADLRTLWKTLAGYNDDLVDVPVVDAWKKYRSRRILQTRDTFFGLYQGSRPGDGSRMQTAANGAIPVPPADNVGDLALVRFVNRLYDFYRMGPQHGMRLDPRRHAPESYATSSLTNPNNLVLRYVAALSHPQRADLAQEWIPKDNIYQRSRGLVGIIAYEPTFGGEMINKDTLLVTTVSTRTQVLFPAPGASDILKRTEPQPVGTGLGFADPVVTGDTAAHEFGHAFGLGDEYEDFAGPLNMFNDPRDAPFDNLMFFNAVRPPGGALPTIDPARIKWLTLPRMTLSSKLLTTSQAAGTAGIEVTVGTDKIANWVIQMSVGARVTVQNFAANAARLQLPLSSAADQRLTNLVIASCDEAKGSLVLTGFAGARPTFAPGSVVFVPAQDGQHQPLFVSDQRVRNLLNGAGPGNHLPLNRNPDSVRPSRDPDSPIDIPGIAVLANPHQLIGIFEGGNHWAGAVYRPAGTCKMRDLRANDDVSTFCFVCKWLLVNVVDPSLHADLHRAYYPGP